MLRSFGAMGTCAASTDEALRALATGAEQIHPFHIILSDISRAVPQPYPTAGNTMLGPTDSKNRLPSSRCLG